MHSFIGYHPTLNCSSETYIKTFLEPRSTSDQNPEAYKHSSRFPRHQTEVWKHIQQSHARITKTSSIPTFLGHRPASYCNLETYKHKYGPTLVPSTRSYWRKLTSQANCRIQRINLSLLAGRSPNC